MKIAAYVTLLCGWVAVASAGAQQLTPAEAAARQAQEEANKKVAMAFFRPGITPEEILELMHPDYIQHNPVFKRFGEENGVKGRAEFELLIKQMRSGARGRGAGAPGEPAAGPRPPQGNPTYAVTADGDLVRVLQQRFLPDPQRPGQLYEAYWFDTWRIKDGKLYEHWDAATLPTPPPAAPAPAR